MNKNNAWDSILNTLMTNALDTHHATQEYQYWIQRQEVIDEILATNLTQSEKALVDELLCELRRTARRESEALYQQGMRDCMWMLKSMGLLA